MCRHHVDIDVLVCLHFSNENHSWPPSCHILFRIMRIYYGFHNYYDIIFYVSFMFRNCCPYAFGCNGCCSNSETCCPLPWHLWSIPFKYSCVPSSKSSTYSFSFLLVYYHLVYKTCWACLFFVYFKVQIEYTNQSAND